MLSGKANRIFVHQQNNKAKVIQVHNIKDDGLDLRVIGDENESSQSQLKRDRARQQSEEQIEGDRSANV